MCVKVGGRGKHKVFGESMITAMKADISCCVIKFDSVATERNLQIGTEHGRR